MSPPKTLAEERARTIAAEASSALIEQNLKVESLSTSQVLAQAVRDHLESAKLNPYIMRNEAIESLCSNYGSLDLNDLGEEVRIGNIDFYQGSFKKSVLSSLKSKHNYRTVYCIETTIGYFVVDHDLSDEDWDRFYHVAKLIAERITPGLPLCVLAVIQTMATKETTLEAIVAGFPSVFKAEVTVETDSYANFHSVGIHACFLKSDILFYTEQEYEKEAKLQLAETGCELVPAVAMAKMTTYKRETLLWMTRKYRYMGLTLGVDVPLWTELNSTITDVMRITREPPPKLLRIREEITMVHQQAEPWNFLIPTSVTDLMIAAWPFYHCYCKENYSVHGPFWVESILRRVFPDIGAFRHLKYPTERIDGRQFHDGSLLFKLICSGFAPSRIYQIICLRGFPVTPQTTILLQLLLTVCDKARFTQICRFLMYIHSKTTGVGDPPEGEIGGHPYSYYTILEREYPVPSANHIDVRDAEYVPQYPAM